MAQDPSPRRHVRYPANLAIRVCPLRTRMDEAVAGRMVDVSEGGICFVGLRYFVPGSAVRIEFEDCHLLAQVRHCRLREYGAHVEFVTGVEVQRVIQGSDTWNALTQAAV